MAVQQHTLSFEELMQATPNYPPYAMEIVGEMGGEAVFGGNISAAMMASLNADIVLACDINSAVVEFYEYLIDEMKKSPFREDFSRHFSEKLDGYKNSGIVVSSGPLSFLPFVFDDELYAGVRSTIGKLQVHKGDFTEFIGWLRYEKHEASLIDANNIPEYVADWQKLFGNPPLKEGGIAVFGKRDRQAYILPNGVIHPGNIKKGLVGYSLTAPPDSIKTVPVTEAMERLGYQHISVPLISSIRQNTSGKLEYFVVQSTGGLTNVRLIEEINRPDSKTAGGSRQIISGGTHTLYTLKYGPAKFKATMK